MTESERSLRVFLCYAPQDKPVVQSLYSQLQDDGVDVWLDVEKVLPGQIWQDEIPTAIRVSQVVIVCLSKNALNRGGSVKKEIGLVMDIANERPDDSILVIPALLDECKIPERLARYEEVNLFETDGYKRLLDSLRKKANEVGVLEPGKKGPLGYLANFTKQTTFSSKMNILGNNVKPGTTVDISTRFNFKNKYVIRTIEVIGVLSSIFAVLSFLTGRENIAQFLQLRSASIPSEPAPVIEQPVAEPSLTLPAFHDLTPTPSPSATYTPSPIVVITDTITNTPQPGYEIVEPDEVLNIAPQLRSLGQLAVEKYTAEERNRMNNTLTFTVQSTPDVPILWRWFWCAANDRILEQNMTKISVIFEADGRAIPKDQLATIVFKNADPTYDGWKCLTYETVLRDWKPGTYKFIQTMTVSSAINDGRDTFEAGYKIYEYTVNISP